MSNIAQKKTARARKHWTQKSHESVIRRDANNQFHLEVDGGASQGLFPLIKNVDQTQVCYEEGKVLRGELLLEVNNKRVSGMTARDVTALMRRATDPISLKTVKQNSTITKDLKMYLGTRFQKGSVDYEVQESIRKNLYQRTTPCTTRPRREGEKHGKDYFFLTREQFKMMEERGDLLESGVFDGHLYGTPKPPENPEEGMTTSMFGTPAKEKSLNVPPNKLPPNMASSPGHRAVRRQAQILKNLGPLPPNWEISYTEGGEKYFIDHTTGTTHWLDPRLRRMMKMDPLQCEDDELPFGWQVIDDPGVGIYYVNHIHRRTQFENPVLQARMGSAPNQQAVHPQQIGGYPMSYPPPPIQPSNFQLQYQQESPPRGGGLRPPPPIPIQPPPAGYMGSVWPEGWTPELVLARIEGEQVITQLKNFGTGFGFVLIGGDSPGELLVIKDIMSNSPAEQDGILEKDDILVRVNDQIILMRPHQDVVQLIKSVQMGSVVEIEIRRNALYPPLRGFDQEMETPSNPNQSIPYQEIQIEIERGQFGFGFTITDGTGGQGIKSINDAERCLKLRVGDLLARINGRDVLHMSHQDVVDILKSCPKGLVCEFIVRRDIQHEIPMHTKIDQKFQEETQAGFQYQENISHQKNGSMEQQSPPPPIPPHEYDNIEILLRAKESGFGFAITGGAEEGSQVSIGRVISEGSADLDGRLQVGDEITHVNNENVQGATHRDVISLIANSSINKSILLRVSRPTQLGTVQRMPAPQLDRFGPRIVSLEKQQDESFGFVIQSNGMDGSIISRLLDDSPAMRSGQLQLGDMIVQVNGEDVRGMSHQEVVSRIKASTHKIALTVLETGSQDDSPDGGPQLQLQPSSPAQSHKFAMAQNLQERQVQLQPMGEPFPAGDDEEYNPQHEEDGDVFLIEILKNEEGFGFSLHGGADVGYPLKVMKIAQGKAADRDGRLQANDEILEINGQDTQGMMHHDAINQIKYGGGAVKLVIRRPFGQEEFKNP